MAYYALHSENGVEWQGPCLLLLIFKAKVLTPVVCLEEHFYWEWAASSENVGQILQGWDRGQGFWVLFPIDQLLPRAFAVLPV